MRKVSYRVWARAVIYAATALWAIACTSGNGDESDNGDECERGTERCACLDGACLAGLTCLSEVCVRDMSGTGGAQGGSAGASAGGSPQGGSGASPTGGVGSGAGGGATGGTSGGGGTGAVPGASGSAGASGGGGSAGMCAADTQTDPENCGSCGKVCRMESHGICDGVCCMNGNCRDEFGDCLRPSSGFVTCVDYCASIGEECVPQGCGTSTYRIWAGADSCEQFAASVGEYNGACDVPIDFDIYYIRCCCTDRAP